MSVLDLLGYYDSRCEYHRSLFTFEEYYLKTILGECYLLMKTPSASPGSNPFNQDDAAEQEQESPSKLNDHKFQMNTGNFPRDISRNPRPDRVTYKQVALFLEMIQKQQLQYCLTG